MAHQRTQHAPPPNRLAGLYRFAVAITIFNILGHVWFGFEQSWAHPLVALLTAYSIELLLETVDARVKGRRPRFRGGGGGIGGVRSLVEFLLSAHITALAVAMLLYPNERLMPIVFGTAVAICSKHVFRAATEGGSRHYFNPSNLGIAATLLLFPSVGIVPPYHFTENLGHIGGWILPAIIVVSGSLLNTVYTKRLALIVAWVTAFAAQAVVRNVLFGTPLLAALAPMTGVAFVLFTFYMVTDPATTPSKPIAQVIFGSSVAAAYGILMAVHVVFGLFFALAAVCLLRGMYMHVLAVRGSLASALGRSPTHSAAEVPADSAALGRGFSGLGSSHVAATGQRR